MDAVAKATWLAIGITTLLITTAMSDATDENDADDISDSRIRLSALGRPMSLGMLYDIRSDRILPGG